VLNQKLSWKRKWDYRHNFMYFLISTLHLGERSASQLCHFIAGEKEPIHIKSKMRGRGGVWRGAVLGSLEKTTYFPYAGYRNRAPWSFVYSLFTIKTEVHQLERGSVWTLKGPGNCSTCGEENDINNADLERKLRQG